MKIIYFILLIFASIVVLAATDQYLFCPFYTFTNTKVFAGDSIYNPYASALPGDWVKCNFHAHVHCWDGVTNGCGTAANANRLYNSLHYGVHVISNYQSIDTSSNKLPGYITGYEHGYNMRKNHQLVLGADKICWKDYLLPQTINNKQDILNHLSTDTNSLVIINHPLVRNAYSSNDFKYLTNYNCMEVLSPSCISTSLWDAALSAGKPVFIVGNDDVHNIYDSNKVGRICTWINVTALNKVNILKALRTGNSYGMIIGKEVVLEERRTKNINLPALQSLIMNGNTMKVKLSKPAKDIIITGRYGKVLYEAHTTDSIIYTLGIHESYAREVALYNDGTQLFLNPVLRYHTNELAQSPISVNMNKTLFYRVIGIVVLLCWFSIMRKLAFRKSKTKEEFLQDNINLNYGFIQYAVHRFLCYVGLQRKNPLE